MICIIQNLVLIAFHCLRILAHKTDLSATPLHSNRGLQFRPCQARATDFQQSCLATPRPTVQLRRAPLPPGGYPGMAAQSLQLAPEQTQRTASPHSHSQEGTLVLLLAGRSLVPLVNCTILTLLSILAKRHRMQPKLAALVGVYGRERILEETWSPPRCREDRLSRHVKARLPASNLAFAESALALLRNSPMQAVLTYVHHPYIRSIA